MGSTIRDVLWPIPDYFQAARENLDLDLGPET